jgi:uroporphyrinogen-III synthase
MSFEGLRVLSLESRRAAEIEVLIRKQGGEPFVAPSVKERALDDHTDAFRMLDSLERGDVEMLVLMTGVGLSFWRDVISTQYSSKRADDALAKVTLLARGPKPSAVLRSIGLTPDITIPEPNTWREIVRVMEHRPERRLAIQEYGRPNPEFIKALEALGIHCDAFALYRWELPDEVGPLRRAVRELAANKFDVVLFTSSIQLEHLLAIAAEEGLQKPVLETLQHKVAVASVGPIMNASLIENGLAPDIVPQSPKMGALVKAAGDEAAAVLAAKRARATNEG